jgi:hypothetical protein
MRDKYDWEQAMSVYDTLSNEVMFIKAKTVRAADKETKAAIEEVLKLVDWMRSEYIAHSIEEVERGA